MSPARTPTIVASLLALVCIAHSGTADAADDTFRCGSKLVSPGLDPDTVVKLCGEPASRRTETVPRYTRNANGAVLQNGTVTVEYWTYDRGSTQFPALLKFEEGRLTSVELVRP